MVNFFIDFHHELENKYPKQKESPKKTSYLFLYVDYFSIIASNNKMSNEYDLYQKS